MKRRRSDRLVVFALRHHGPLSDAQLVWWLGFVGMKAGTAKTKRRRLTQLGIVRRHESAGLNSHGQLVNRWEIEPKYRHKDPFSGRALR
jgi:hypothetical protein